MSNSLESLQVTHSQGMVLMDSQNMQGRSVHWPTPVKIVDPSPMLPHTTTIPCVQTQVTPVTFASTTQVRTDIPVPSTVNQMVCPTPELRVPLSQITSVTSTLNTQTPSQAQGQNTDPCRKCGRKNHKTDKCRKKVTCKNCRKKDHSTKFCTVIPTQEDKCSYCGKGKHTAENCRARKKAEKKGKSAGTMATASHVSTSSSSLTQHSQDHPSLSQSSEMPPKCTPLLVTPAAAPTIGQHLQQMAMQNDVHAMLTLSQNVPTSEAPPIYNHQPGMDGNRPFSQTGFTHSIPTLASGMYDFIPNTGAQSMTSNASLESHMSQLSKAMVQLTQTNQAMAASQQQNQLASVTAQQQQADIFNTLPATTEQRKYDALFTAVPKFDGTNKDCAVWLSRIAGLVATTGRDFHMKLLN